MTDETVVYIGVGSNLGDRQRTIKETVARLRQNESGRVLRVSTLRETAPLGDDAQPPYLNGVVEMVTSCTPRVLLSFLQGIESALGRQQQRQHWAARPIDLDLLLYGDRILHEPELILPHAQLHLRSFVLEPLIELAPDIQHPVLGVTLTELAGRLQGGDFCRPAGQAGLVSVAGNIGVGKTTLAKRLATALVGQILVEPYDSNPFLPQVYAGKQELALDSQLYFLANRVDQLHSEKLEPDKLFIADYVFDKERIYARQLLDANQLSLYERLYQGVAVHVLPPALVIYLHDSVQRCQLRIQQRNRSYEQEITLKFLTALDQAYEQLFEAWYCSPIIRLDTSTFDCLNDTHLETLARQIGPYVNPVRHAASSLETKGYG
ncbi:2-amino-4-hydroxy-6-hydroxymethyldihydropteridine diphosphokinase [Planctomycetota bacterium]